MHPVPDLLPHPARQALAQDKWTAVNRSRRQVFDLKGINKDVEASRFPHLFLCGKVAKNLAQYLVISGFFCIFAMYKKGGSGHEKKPNNSPFKTCKIMNKTVRKILQAISYLITLLLGAAGGSTLM